MILVIIILGSHSFISNAQSTWNLNGNDNTNSSSLLGTTNNKPLKIQTNNHDRIIVGTNDSIQFKGTAIFDSIKLGHGFIQADSGRFRTLHIGDSSITIGSGTFGGATSTSTNNNNITCSNGILNFGRSPGFGAFDDCYFNIGTQTNTYKLHIHDNGTTANPLLPAWAHFTNSVTGQTQMDGLLVGVFNNIAGVSSTTAAILQREQAPLRLYTSATLHMILQGSAGATDGFVGIGTNFTNPLSLLHLNNSGANALETRYTNSASTNGFKTGIDASSNGAINNTDAKNINISTNNVQRMTVIGPTGATQGFVGIGNAFTNPQYLLDVKGGDINVSTNNDAYRIGGDKVLWHYGNTSNIIVGVNAGNTSLTGYDLTLVGNNAGNQLATAQGATLIGSNAGFSLTRPTPLSYDSIIRNTFVGAYAGYSDQIGRYNTFMGYAAGYNSIADYNTFIGDRAGQNTTSGSRNVFLGYLAGLNNQTGTEDCYIGSHQTLSGASTGNFNNFIGSDCGPSEISGNDNQQIGRRAGYHNSSGNANIFIGSNAGNEIVRDSGNIFIGYRSARYVNSGSMNLFLGHKAGYNSNVTSISQAAALGANSVARNSYQMILGQGYTNSLGNAENVKVGIGLSNDATGPQNYLEINADPTGNAAGTCTYNSALTGLSGGTGLSGLKFRQLHNTNTVSTLTSGKVLSVDATGNVILVNDQQGTNGLPYCGAATALTADVEIPLAQTTANEHNLYITGTSTMTTTKASDVGVGFSCGAALDAKVHVNNYTITQNGKAYSNLISGHFVTNGSVNNNGGYEFIGVKGETNVTPNNTNSKSIGGDFYGNNSYNNYGLRAQAVSNNYTGGTGYNTGLLAFGSNSTVRGVGVLGAAASNTALGVGVLGVASSNNAANANNSINVGVMGRVYCTTNCKVDAAIYGTVEQPNGSACPANPTTYINKYAGYFNGNFLFTGIQLGTSDSILKTNVQPLIGDSALRIISNLNPKTYTFRQSDYPSMALPSGTQMGLIAQQVERVVPNVVSNVIHPARFDDSTGAMLYDAINYKALNYNAFIPLLIAGVKQLNNHANGATNGVSINSGNQYEWGNTALTHTTVLPMNGNNIYFTDNQQANNNIGVGHITDDNLLAKVDVVTDCNDANLIAGKFLNTGDCGGENTLVGVNGSSEVNNNLTNIGGDFSAYNGRINIGVRGTISGSPKPTDPSDPNGNVAPGGYAVYGDAGNSNNFWAGYFNGYVGTTCGWYQASDGKLKENVKQLSVAGSRSIINQLRPSTYTFKADQQKAMNLPSGNQYGLIAEDVEKVMPELVREMSVPAKTDKQGNITTPSQTFKGVNYVGMIPVLISALQQTDSINSKLLARLDAQQKQIDALQSCCGYNNKVPTNLGNNTSTELSDLGIILDQNAPNPFAEQTVITYTIPESVQDARLIFYTNNGTILKTVQISERGAGSMTVYASNLSTGIYTYSLIADGKVADTKKMVCTKH